MKIIQNIPSAFKLYSTLKHLNLFKKEIDDAKSKGDFQRERDTIRKAQTTWGNNVLRIFGSSLTVEGKENLPEQGPVVFVGNHQGYADIIAYCAALETPQFGFIAKEDLGKIPVYGTWIKRIRSVLIKRGDARASLRAIDEGIKLIEQGFSLMIFPEGTRSKGPDPGEFKKGSIKLATKPGVPIIPVSLNGSYKMYEETGVLKGADIKVLIHPPIETKGLSRPEEKALTGKVEEIIVNGIRSLQKEV